MQPAYEEFVKIKRLKEIFETMLNVLIEQPLLLVEQAQRLDRSSGI